MACKLLNIESMYKSPQCFGLIALLSALTMTTGCVADDATSDAEAGAEVDLDPESNGVDINGRDVNGRDVNGRDVNGRDVNGRDVNGIMLDKSQISAIHTDGTISSGSALIGMELDTTTSDGKAVTLRIDNVEEEPSFYNGELVHMYTISTKSKKNKSWVPLCGADASGAAVRSVPLQGRWDYRQGVPGGGSKIDDPDFLTFACEGYTLQKCVRLGYEPWRTVNGTLLSDHHQACVRLHRADYCGDGRSFTMDGMLINLYDDLGVQSDTESWVFEAEWTTEGARCVSSPRISGKKYTPTCAFEIPAADCGKSIDWSVTLLANEQEQ
jgi:hypothetical protein